MTNSSIHAPYYPRHRITLRIYTTLPIHNSSMSNHTMGILFIYLGVGGLIRIPLLVYSRPQRARCFLSLTRTDSDVKMHCSEAIHSWLAMAPAVERTPHNNELLSPPEDTMPAQRIEMKRQVRHDGCRRGKGGGSGGYSFNIQKMLNI